MAIGASADARIAVLVDCDNVPPDILDHALRVAAQFGRVVVRRGYGNATTLGVPKWRDALVRQAFTPCLQYHYAAGKNTSDLALALEAMEVLFDDRADTFCLVSSDSDFAYLCRKLRERGATVHIVGESKTPDALRNASDQFFEWAPLEQPAAEPEPAEKVAKHEAPAPKPAEAKPAVKRRPRSVVEAVALLTADTSEGKVSLSALGNYLRRTEPSFSPQTYGHSGLLSMVKTYDLLALSEDKGVWYVRLSAQAAPQGAPTEG
ncbi:NYN domain-containing protein [Tahibacter sp.]|uniref:NYN domain-containing protein n=1 Tax=Tahibacter sp. TaxID=2056211 RepID=UPI0028C40F60|nr:NYN domain-containing protein [Tahibacter sp.]